MKYAVEISELLTRTVIVDANEYLEAEEEVRNGYYNRMIELNADNSLVVMTIDNIVEIFDGYEFDELDLILHNIMED